MYICGFFLFYHRLDQMFSDAFSRDHQLIKADPKHSLYLACALMVRGNVEISDVRRNIERWVQVLVHIWTLRGGGTSRNWSHTGISEFIQYRISWISIKLITDKYSARRFLALHFVSGWIYCLESLIRIKPVTNYLFFLNVDWSQI